MKRFLVPNLERKGRLIRAFIAVALLISAAATYGSSPRLSLALTGLSLFLLFEAVRGWCVARACGIKTRL